MTIQDYLDMKNIPYWTHGKNVSKGYIGIRCVNPLCRDRSNHLGIRLRDGRYKCWICGIHGEFKSLLRRFGESPSAAADISNSIYFADKTSEYIYTHKITGKLEDLMRDFKSPISKEHRIYLENRGYPADKWEKKYSLMSADHIGDQKFRLIIPCKMEGRTVGFIGRDTTGKSQLKYKTSPESHNLLPRREWIFNSDSVKDCAIIVEGCMDAMNLGDGSIALFSTSFTQKQVESIIKMNLNRCFVMFDGESTAIEQAYRLAYELSPFIKLTEVLELPEDKDPGDLTESDVRALRREVF